MDQEKQVSRQARLFGGSVPWDEIHVELEALTKPTLSLEAMEELIQEVELTSDKVILDVGAYGGSHAIELASKYGCRAIALDLVLPGLVAAREEITARNVERLVSRVQGDAHALPLRASTVDLIWSRDMLSCVEPRMFLRECGRVLKAGGFLALHAVYMTEMMGHEERGRFAAALALSDGCDRKLVENAISETGFRIINLTEVGSGSREHELATGNQRLLEDLLAIMRLRRGTADLIARFGSEWYETILASHEWMVFMALGKLHDAVYLLRLERADSL